VRVRRCKARGRLRQAESQNFNFTRLARPQSRDCLRLAMSFFSGLLGKLQLEEKEIWER
jgi:hypothetical protein